MTHPNKREIHSKVMELNQKRKKDNEAILTKIVLYLEANPGIRFNQALINMNIIKEETEFGWDNDYYTEPSEVLKRMK
jgi:hypothetical protein